MQWDVLMREIVLLQCYPWNSTMAQRVLTLHASLQKLSSDFCTVNPFVPRRMSMRLHRKLHNSTLQVENSANSSQTKTKLTAKSAVIIFL